MIIGYIFALYPLRVAENPMDIFEIEGGVRLKGTIDVRGLKNAATPILAATILTKEECVLSNVPRIEDVFRMIEILESMGAIVEWRGTRTLAITNKSIDPSKMDAELVKKIRSSILLLGPLAARFDSSELYHPGGCVIGARPVGTHFDALAALGVDIVTEGKAYHLNARKRKSGKVVLREMSVTATENAMMLAAGIPGKTIIKLAAAEPHVEDLGKFLQKMGAKIHGLGTHTIEITGTKRLSGARHAIVSDHNEAATFLVLGVATGSAITVRGANEDHLDAVLTRLRQFGADFKIKKNMITVVPAKKLMAVEKIDTRTYPGLPTETQSLFGVLATLAEGDTLIFDTLFEGRFNYVPELEKMGAKAAVLNPHQVLVHGPTKLKGTVIRSFDLRAGVALIIAALCAKGTTRIDEVYQVDRGYERIEERLQKLGAKIKRIQQ
jgi:UDP-N-acetylglucosamine 1-carboxyvinyltransferase